MNRGTSTPYGLAIIFTIACAGHVQVTPPSYGDGPSANPVGCFDANGNQLGADDFVLSYSLVYAFSSLTNANPVIDHLAFQGNTVDLNAGVTIPHCTESDSTKCPSYNLQVFVPASSQEVDPQDIGMDGKALKEEIWADYFVTAGSVANGAVILYDPSVGALPNSNAYTSPQNAGENLIWVVVHDNRGGAAWVQVPLHVT